MQAIGYGIIIGALMWVAMVIGAILMLQVKAAPNWKAFGFLNDKGEEEEIRKAGVVKPANYDDEPQTAEQFHETYKREGFHEELPHAPKN